MKYIPSVPRCTWRMLAGTACANSAFDIFAGQDAWLTHKVRTAIRHACKLAALTTGGEVLVPSYHCGSEVDTIVRAGARIRFYRIDSAAQIDLADLARRIGPDTKAIYVTHFFGFQRQASDVRKLCDDHDILLIEDCALVSFSEKCDEPVEAAGDLSVYSFTKTLPVPNGGALVVRNRTIASKTWVMRRSPPLDVVRQMAMLAKQAAAIPLRRALPSPIAGSGSERVSPLMPASYRFFDRMTDAAISPISLRMLGRISAAEVVAQRRRNFSALDALLRNRLPPQPWREGLYDGVCPLMYPVLADDRKPILSHLHRRGVDAIPFWAGYHPDYPLQDFPEARRLKDNLIGLPVHQDLDESDMTYVAAEVISAFQKGRDLP